MSTFDGNVFEFPRIRIDNFNCDEHSPAPLACFLSHVHSDHLRGLEYFKSPFIYCSAATKEILLRLEKYPHRMNFAKNILECRKQTYKHLKKLLRPIPLETPTDIELSPGVHITVTLYDANHCTGAVMFLIEDQGKAILYTGDVRCEDWWISKLVRHPTMVAYSSGLKRLDNIYLDTTFASSEQPYKHFPSKADGISELIEKLSHYPPDAVFYFNTWTFGYEDCWVALSHALGSKVHLDRYRYRLYHSLADNLKCEQSEVAPLIGFEFGHSHHSGCLTMEDVGVRIHSCERGTQCHIHDDRQVVTITPIITRHQGLEYREMGAGGGQGDLDQVHELELTDVAAVGRLLEICRTRFSDHPDLGEKVRAWLTKYVMSGDAIKLDTSIISSLLDEDKDVGSDDIPLDRLLTALDALTANQVKDPESTEITAKPRSRSITFPYSRHASYGELRQLVKALKPKRLVPNTVTPELDMTELFGDLLTEGANKYEAVQPHTRNAQGFLTTSTFGHVKEDLEQSPAAIAGGPKAGQSAGNIIDNALAEQELAAKVAIGLIGSVWGRDVDLTSVAGYHNQIEEVEL